MGGGVGEVARRVLMRGDAGEGWSSVEMSFFFLRSYTWNSTCFLRVIGFFDDRQWLNLSRSVLSLGLLRIPKLFTENLLTIEQ